MEVAVIVCLGWIFAVCFHEFGHAIVAYWGGDTSVKDKGYLTFNILKYTDPGMTLFFPVLILILGGIALPGAAVYIDHSRLRSRLWASAVSAAGPIASAITAVLVALPFLLHLFPPAVPAIVWAGLAFLIQLLVFSCILNSLPIPPFDGYGVIEPWLPKSVRQTVNAYSNYSIWIVLLLMWTVQPFNLALWSTTDFLAGLLGVPAQLSNVGYKLFKEHSGWLVVALLAFLFLMHKRDKKKSELEWFKEAKELIGRNEATQAVNALNEALTINPNFPEAWHLRGISFGLLNRNDEALQNFDKALSINPQYADCWYNRGCCNAQLGKNDAALQDLQRAMQLNPKGLPEHAKQDVGFKTLWNDARFLQITEQR